MQARRAARPTTTARPAGLAHAEPKNPDFPHWDEPAKLRTVDQVRIKRGGYSLCACSSVRQNGLAGRRHVACKLSARGTALQTGPEISQRRQSDGASCRCSSQLLRQVAHVSHPPPSSPATCPIRNAAPRVEALPLFFHQPKPHSCQPLVYHPAPLSLGNSAPLSRRGARLGNWISQRVRS
jgi:hypothetical protein